MKWNVHVAVAVLVMGGVLHSQDAPPAVSLQPKTSYCGTPTHFSDEFPMGRLVRRVTPQYPEKARRAKREGAVTLAATIAKDGTVKDLNVRAGDPLLADAAVEAVKLWRYKPFVVQGTAVEVPTVITVTFALEGNGQVSLSEQAGDPGSGTALAAPPASVNSTEPYPIYAVGGEVKPPKPVYHPDPSYTKSAQKAKTQGTVALAIVITPGGDVQDVEVCKNLEPSLDQRAVETVRRWRFEPATKDGKPVATHINVEVTFRLY
jgi:TonB family protein